MAISPRLSESLRIIAHLHAKWIHLLTQESVWLVSSAVLNDRKFAICKCHPTHCNRAQINNIASAKRYPFGEMAPLGLHDNKTDAQTKQKIQSHSTHETLHCHNDMPSRIVDSESSRLELSTCQTLGHTFFCEFDQPLLATIENRKRHTLNPLNIVLVYSE